MPLGVDGRRGVRAIESGCRLPFRWSGVPAWVGVPALAGVVVGLAVVAVVEVVS